MTMKWLAFMLLLSAFLSAEAQTINAASCNASDVQKAFNSVTASTSTVNIPAGTCHWSTQVTLTVPSGSTTLTIAGAGSCNGTPTEVPTSCTNSTQIVDDYNSTNSLLVVTTGTASTVFRMTGVSIAGGTGTVHNNGTILWGGFSQNFRFDDGELNMQTYSPSANQGVMRFANWIYGVVDNSIFDLVGTGNGIEVWMDEYNNDSAGFGDDAWADSTNFGTNKFIYVETNKFFGADKFGTANDCSHGGKFVFRYNTMSQAQLQTHPTGGSGRARGCRAWEIYMNTFSGDNSGGGANAGFNLMFMSSGTGLMWGNSATTGYTNFVTMHSMQTNNSTYGETATPNGWGYCGTSSGLGGDGSQWDQTQGSSGYACIDQPGRGVGDLLQGQFPNACDVTSGGCATNVFTGTWPNQALEPMYEWMDMYTPVPGAGGAYLANYNPAQLVNNQDFYLWCNPSSASGCLSFNGTVGTGSGSLASRPATCTTGVVYWGTDAQTLYKCASTNTWTTYYTPYTYPHPLVQGQGQPPSPPTNLQANVD